MLRVIEEIKPTWVVGENVAGIVSLALDQVLSDLESKGYETQAFIIPACGVDAPHDATELPLWLGTPTAGTGTKSPPTRTGVLAQALCPIASSCRRSQKSHDRGRDKTQKTSVATKAAGIIRKGLQEISEKSCIRRWER